MSVSDLAHALSRCGPAKGTLVRYNWFRPDLYKRERDMTPFVRVCCDTYYLHDVISLPLNPHNKIVFRILVALCWKNVLTYRKRVLFECFYATMTGILT